MKLKAKINVAPAKSYFDQLAKATGRSLPDTIKGEGAAIVAKAMSYQKTFKISDVRQRAIRKGVAEFKKSGDAFGGTTNVGKRNTDPRRQWMVGRRPLNKSTFSKSRVMPMGIWNGNLGGLVTGARSSGTKGKHFKRSKNGTRIYKRRQSNGWYAPAADWSRYVQAWNEDKQKTKKAIQDRIGARGITQKSWFEIIEKIGAGTHDVAGFNFRLARPISGRSRQVAEVEYQGEGTGNFTMRVSNTSGVAIAAGGQRKLEAAIAVRRAFFVRAVRSKWLDTVKGITDKYPWAKIT